MKRKFGLIIITLILSVSIFAQKTILFQESFESPTFPPTGWSQIGAIEWERVESGGSASVATDGDWYVLFSAMTWTSLSTKLISPTIDLSSPDMAVLKFDLANADDGPGYFDDLNVYYSTNNGGTWNLLKHFDQNIYPWEAQTLCLPDINANYKICFEGVAHYGYGICLDKVEIESISTDNLPPEIIVPEIDNYVWTNQDKEVEITILDNSDISNAALHYKPQGQSWQTINMTDIGEHKFYASIPGQEEQTPVVYHFTAEDTESNICTTVNYNIEWGSYTVLHYESELGENGITIGFGQAYFAVDFDLGTEYDYKLKELNTSWRKNETANWRICKFEDAQPQYDQMFTNLSGTFNTVVGYTDIRVFPNKNNTFTGHFAAIFDSNYNPMMAGDSQVNWKNTWYAEEGSGGQPSTFYNFNDSNGYWTLDATIVVRQIIKPILLSAKTSIDGATIELAFNKEMANPEFEPVNNFILNTNNGTSILLSNIALKSDDNTKIILTPEEPITCGSVINLSYTKGTIMCYDYGVLEDFSDYSVTNNSTTPFMPLSSMTSADGTILELAFDIEIDDPSAEPLENFSVIVDDIENPITNIELKPENPKILILTLTDMIACSQTVNLSYTLGTIQSIDGCQMSDFLDFNVIPEILTQPISAETSTDGTIIKLTIYEDMADPSSEPPMNFVAVINSEINNLGNEISLDGTNSKILNIALNDTIYQGQSITLKYTPGYLESVEGCYLTEFEEFFVTNNSSIEQPLSIEKPNKNNFSVYPNPSNGIFSIINNELQITNILITDITGKIICKQQSVIRNSQFVINEKGIYFIKIQTKDQIFTQKLIIQ